MSGLIGNPSDGAIIFKDDERLLSDYYRQDVELADFGPTVGDMRSPWWPGGSGLYGDLNNDIGVLEIEGSWGYVDMTGGAQTRYGVIGITRDAFGSPLGAMTVKLYRTSTDEMVNSTVSDASGNYAVYTPYYPDTHYIVVYKAGSPDVFGTSANTIVGR